ncbi:sigma-70 family RNA polymerase sigma factor [Brassicibacter mesophilus]|uniref:sigma-70 family RNA polymerase sigma factor n=1 Tax=Brassicibacter mesophilus TaxID=745119 RepID=UPI003D1AFAED
MYLNVASSTNFAQIQKMKKTMYKVIGEDLTERQREFIVMYYLEDKTMQQIADELRVTKENVSITIKRGLNRIKKSKKIKKFL